VNKRIFFFYLNKFEQVCAGLSSHNYVTESFNYSIPTSMQALQKPPLFYHCKKNFFEVNLHYLQCPRNGMLKFQHIVVSSFGVRALDSRNSKEITLYKNKLQELTFTIITSSCITWRRFSCKNYDELLYAYSIVCNTLGLQNKTNSSWAGE